MSDKNTTRRLMREGLAHHFPGMKDSDFFALIDATGGWPLDYRSVGFEHTDNRAAGFTNSPNNDGWWTVVADSDDYYLWKLSPAALQRVVDAAVSTIRLPKVNAQAMWIKNSRGHRAFVAQATKEPK